MKKKRMSSFIEWLVLAFSTVAVATSSSSKIVVPTREATFENGGAVKKPLVVDMLQDLESSRRLGSYSCRTGGYGSGCEHRYGYGHGYSFGHGYGYGHGNSYGYGSSKSSKSSKSGKGKSGSKSSKSRKGYYPLPGKGSGEKTVNCKNFDYLANYVPIYGKGKGKGKGFYGRQLQSEGGRQLQSEDGRQLQSEDGRQLQFEGEDCTPNTLDVAACKSELSIFVDLVHAAGLEDLFTCAGPFTVLAPSNEAFSKNPELLDYLFDPHNKEDLEETLFYHILPGFYLQSDFHDGPYRTLQRGTVEVSTYPFGFNQALVTSADILGCNGAIHIIDDVLIPQGNDYLPEECADLDFRAPGEFPFDIRSNDSGGYDSYTNGMSSVYGNGFNRRKLQYQGHICDPNVLDAARQDPNLSTAVMLIETAGLSDIFLCAGPFTFAIPNNAAFSKLNPSLLSSLMDPANVDTLREILLYHLLPGAQFTGTLQAGPQATLQGEDVEIALNPVRFNDGEVIQPDNAACNGVYHVIDEVLIPPSIEPGMGLPPTEPEVPEICSMLDFRALRRKLQFEGELCEPNVLEIARKDPELSTFVTLAEQSGVDIIFLCAGPFTSLLPTNAAFDALDDDLREFLLDPANVDTLQEVLLYHIVAGLELTTELVEGPLLTLQGENVIAAINPVTFNGELVLAADIPACNGVIDKLEGVLIPPSFIPETSGPTSQPLTLPPVTSAAPTPLQTASPTATPTAMPPGMTAAPTPLQTPPLQTLSPTATPTTLPPDMTMAPTPADTPVLETDAPTSAATPAGSQPGTTAPTSAGTTAATTSSPTTAAPLTLAPTLAPSTAAPTAGATTGAPSTAAPVVSTPVPTVGGSDAPSSVPTSLVTLTRAPTVAPSTQGPTVQPTIELVRVRVTDYFIAYGVPGMPSEPTEEDVQGLLEQTRVFWTGYFEEHYADQSDIKFNGLNLEIVETKYNAGIPEPQFNFYIEFDTVVLYDLDTATPPGAGETFSIMADANFTSYIIDHVRSIPVFQTCDEIDFRAVEMLVPASLSLDGAREGEQPEEGGVPVGILSAAVGAAALATALATVVLFKRKKERERSEFGKVVQEASSGSENTVTDETHSESTFNNLVAALQRKTLQEQRNIRYTFGP